MAASLLDLTDLSTGLKFEGAAAQDVLDLQLSIERNMYSGPFREFELDLRKAVENSDEASIKDLVRHSDMLGSQDEGKANVTRVLWKVIVDAPLELGDLILTSVTVPFDFGFIDDINGRTCLHEAAAAGSLRLVNLCLEKGSRGEKLDAYGRSALHYAAMHGHTAVCKQLLEAGVSPHVLDVDNCGPVVYATLRGSAECVQVLICDQCIALQSPSPNSSLLPLSLASQHGYTDIVSLLLEEGAKCVPNTNGEFPIHLAAREGHADVCKLLLDQDGWDLPDKYHEWTPLFHAARNGHTSCLHILLQAGARVDRTDELDHQAIHYAAWYGHRACVDLLLKATPKEPPTVSSIRVPAVTRTANDMQIDDPDSIPSLSLPPPIMPHRVYGHNYLDKNYLVMITVGLPPAPDPRWSGKAIRFHPRLSDSILAQSVSLPSPNRLKMVITAGPGVNAAPYTITLPQKNNYDTFMFQASSLKDLTLEFSIYPNFGTKTIGRAVAHPFILHSPDGSFTTLSILDHRLHSMGEVCTRLVPRCIETDVRIQVSFSAHVITPFQGITLEVGGAVETYWKSLTLPQGSLLSRPQTVPPWRQSPKSMDSTHTSPSILSAPASPLHTVTLSSLSGNYIYAVVQVTRDLQPVLFGEQLLPESSYDLGVADVTLVQFDALANRLDRGEQLVRRVTSIQDWYRILPRLMLPLSRFVQVRYYSIYIYIQRDNLFYAIPQLLPVHLGLTLELALSPSQPIKRHLDLNLSVNAVFRTIKQTSTSLGGAFARRRIAFTSFSPQVCAALNWKQPNCNHPLFHYCGSSYLTFSLGLDPVFFSSRCGQANNKHGSSPANPDVRDTGDDQYSSSVAEGVEFAKANNLLGVFFDSELLVIWNAIRDRVRLTQVYVQ